MSGRPATVILGIARDATIGGVARALPAFGRSGQGCDPDGPSVSSSVMLIVSTTAVKPPALWGNHGALAAIPGHPGAAKMSRFRLNLVEWASAA